MKSLKTINKITDKIKTFKELKPFLLGEDYQILLETLEMGKIGGKAGDEQKKIRTTLVNLWYRLIMEGEFEHSPVAKTLL